MLDQLVLREIQLQRANRVGITVSDDTLNQALARVAQNLGYTLEELPAVLAGENIDYAQYREDSRQDLMIEQLQQRDVMNRISITPRELDHCLAQHDANAVERVRLQHLAHPDQHPRQRDAERTSPPHARRSTTSTRGSRAARISRSSRSQDSQAQTALDGGSLGWRKGAQLPTLFADVVAEHAAGRILRPDPKRAAAFRS